MKTSRRSYYRNTYLKSDHWQDLRLRKLAQQKGRCNLCHEEAFNNDVHHIRYRKLYDVRLEDLKVLCRHCHDAVHDFMEAHPELRRLHPHDAWSAVRRGLWKSYTSWVVKPENPREDIGVQKAILKRARKRLLESGVIKDTSLMPRRTCIYRAIRRMRPKTDMDVLSICLSFAPKFKLLSQCGEH